MTFQGGIFVFNIAIDVARSRGLLRELIDDTEAEIQLHRGVTPGYASAAAGRDFAAHGAALDQMFCALHAKNLELMQNLVAVGTAAHNEVDVIEESDDRSSGDLSFLGSAMQGE